MRLLEIIRGLRGPRVDGDAVHAAYAAVVDQARDSGLYTDFAVPDTPEGRIEALMLHTYLVLRRLRAAKDAETKAFAQALFDLMFQDLDRNLREMGVSDVVIGKRVKKLAKGFYGRIGLYDRALDTDEDGTDTGDALAAALVDTVYDVDDSERPPAAAPERLAVYVRRQLAALDAQSDAEIVAGRLGFLAAVETLSPASRAGAGEPS